MVFLIFLVIFSKRNMYNTHYCFRVMINVMVQLTPIYLFFYTIRSNIKMQAALYIFLCPIQNENKLLSKYLQKLFTVGLVLFVKTKTQTDICMKDI